MVKQYNPTIDELNYGTIKSHGMVVLLCAYVMAWIILDDNTLYQRGPQKTLFRITTAARIAAPYVMIVLVYHMSTAVSLRAQGGRQQETAVSALVDMLSLLCLAVLANFVLTTVAYVFTYISTMEGSGEADEDYNLDDVVDMRKVRLGYPGKICSFSQESDGFGAFRDYGTLQTIPLGTGTPPLENLAGKMSWYLDVTLSSYDKESYQDTREGKSVFYNGFAFLGDAFSNLFNSVPGLNTAGALIPTVLGLLSVFKSGGATAALMPALIRLTFMFFVVKAHTDTNVMEAIRDPTKAACAQGIIARVVSAILFAIPDHVFKGVLRPALPKPNVSYDFTYYAPAMEFLREEGGFCDPAAWQGYLQWIWRRGSLPDALAHDDAMDALIKEMEGSSMAWPSAVYRTSIMAAYNKLKIDHIGLLDENKGRSEPHLAILEARNSMVSKFISAFDPSVRKTMLKTTMTRRFYEDPKNFHNGEADVLKFKEYQSEYVSRQLRRARDLFKLTNVREHYVDLKKLGLDMVDIKIRFPSLVARGGTHLPDELIADALYLYAEPAPGDKDADFLEFEQAMKRGQRRIARIVTFLANDSTQKRISQNMTKVCGSAFPGPPAFTEQKQYRFNNQTGVFTLLPITEYDQAAKGGERSFTENLKYWAGFKSFNADLGSGRWDDDIGMYV